MTLKVNTCIVGIGSNIHAEKNIREMLSILGNEVKILKTSSFVKTKPIGIVNQADFLNGAVKIETHLEQAELKELLISIENQLWRDHSVGKWGPRTMDLDIVFWNGEIIDEDYHSRDFLRQSVAEIL
jgi:2-amino-4-hydroxy-6-hydroxymethyldihydropteridine diphosphokinase